MNPFKKVFVSVSAQLDTILEGMTDYHAIAKANLDQLQKELNAAKFEIQKIARERKNLAISIQADERQVTKWQERIPVLNEQNQTQALVAVKEVVRLEEELKSKKAQLQSISSSEQKLRKKLSEAESRKKELQMRSQTLFIEEKCNQVQNQTGQGSTTGQLDSILDKWEANVESKGSWSEGLSGENPELEPIRQQFEDQEEKDKLTARLNEILGQKEA